MLATSTITKINVTNNLIVANFQDTYRTLTSKEWKDPEARTSFSFNTATISYNTKTLKQFFCGRNNTNYNPLNPFLLLLQY